MIQITTVNHLIWSNFGVSAKTINSNVCKKEVNHEQASKNSTLKEAKIKRYRLCQSFKTKSYLKNWRNY